MTFLEYFNSNACAMDTISSGGEGFTVIATIYHDDHSEAPDERDAGFWPSLDPASAGYIGPKSQSTLRRHMAKAQKVLRSWKAGRWFYCGVAVTVWRNGVQLTGDYDHALWGVECNYPGADNSYLREVSNELLPEALEAAKAKLKELCACPE